MMASVTKRMLNIEQGISNFEGCTATATIVETYTYDAYGNPTIYDASGSEISNQTSQIGNRYLFQGREYDSATHLYYFRARYYNPITGRWLSKDPKGITGGLNLYLAFGNNPVMFVDPNGQQSVMLSPWIRTGGSFFATEPPMEIVLPKPRLSLPAPKPRLRLPMPKPGRIPPSGLKENPFRPGSWGRGSGSDFEELYRFDKGTPGEPGWRGIDHYHLNGEKPHIPIDVPYKLGANGKYTLLQNNLITLKCH